MAVNFWWQAQDHSFKVGNTSDAYNLRRLAHSLTEAEKRRLLQTIEPLRGPGAGWQGMALHTHCLHGWLAGLPVHHTFSTTFG